MYGKTVKHDYSIEYYEYFQNKLIDSIRMVHFFRLAFTNIFINIFGHIHYLHISYQQHQQKIKLLLGYIINIFLPDAFVRELT